MDNSRCGYSGNYYVWEGPDEGLRKTWGAKSRANWKEPESKARISMLPDSTSYLSRSWFLLYWKKVSLRAINNYASLPLWLY